MFDFLPTERTTLALERIATALEYMAGLNARSEPTGDKSAVLYTDEIEDLKREIRKEAYAERTGKRLAWDEDPPEVQNGSEWSEDA